MAFYRTYIADILGALSPDLAQGVQIVLAGLMSPCISDQYEGNWVYFADTSTTLLPNETLVYFMPPGVSIVKNSPNIQGTLDLTAAGNTNPNSGASEVYVNFQDKTLLANLAFHELMHNILQLDNAMHKDDGLRTGRGSCHEIDGSKQKGHGRGHLQLRSSMGERNLYPRQRKK
jgi:hypothetical protein